MNKIAMPTSVVHLDLVIQMHAMVIDAIRVMEQSNLKTAFVVDDEHILRGIVTNGDLRRFILAGGKIDETVDAVMNVDFKAVLLDSFPEEALKLFDLGYSVVPRIDKTGRYIDYLTPDHSHQLDASANMVVRARAPARISFAGGGTDLTYFFSRLNGLVLNAAIARYATTTLIARPGPEIDIHAHDLGVHQHFGSLMAMYDDPEPSLISATLSLIKPQFGFEIHVASDFPVGSGLGGSSAVTTSVIAAFNELRIDRWSRYEMANLAFQAERISFKINGGWQDQYAAVFGGFNLIEFRPSGNNVNSLRLPQDIIDELEESLILFDTGVAHSSSELHKIQKSQMSGLDGDSKLIKLTQYCVQMHQLLSRGELIKFGEGLDEAWTLKKQTSTAISSPELDLIYDTARRAGALGGKLLGAGAGGHMLFFAPPGTRSRVIAALAPLGCRPSPLRFDMRGAHSWRSRGQK